MQNIKKEITLSLYKANLYSLPIIGMILIVMVIPFIMIWGKEHFLEGFRNTRSFLFIFTLIMGFFLHEVIHFLSYYLIGKVPTKYLKIGFQIKSITPYAHCKKPLTASVYRLSAILPGLLLGIIPGIACLITGNAYIFILTIIFTIAAGGDFLLIWLLRKIPACFLVQDHPEKAGCIILEN